MRHRVPQSRLGEAAEHTQRNAAERRRYYGSDRFTLTYAKRVELNFPPGQFPPFRTPLGVEAFRFSPRRCPAR